MRQQSVTERIANYYKTLSRFWEIQSVVYRPSYADRDGVNLWEEHERLNDWLRHEADELFTLGVSVYH